MRGDANQDSRFNIADAVSVLSYLFGGKNTDCTDSLDVNDDGRINLADPISLLAFLFKGYFDIPEPFAACGPDPTQDQLTCAEFAPCN